MESVIYNSISNISTEDMLEFEKTWEEIENKTNDLVITYKIKCLGSSLGEILVRDANGIRRIERVSIIHYDGVLTENEKPTIISAFLKKNPDIKDMEHDK